MKRNLRVLTAVAVTSLAAVLSAHASSVVISGTDLSGLTYRDNGGIAQYVAGTPDVAHLFTSDSGLDGGVPTVFVKPANIGQPSLGTLDSFSASYSLSGPATGPNGTQPYWLTYLNEPDAAGGFIGVVSFGGPDLNASTQIHVFYDFANNPLSSNDYWGETLGQLDSTAYGTTTFGQLTVFESGVEIGDWDNDGQTIAASADIRSITIGTPVPLPSAAGMGLASLAAIAAAGLFRKKFSRA